MRPSLLIAILLPAGAVHAADGFRVWTDARRQRIEAELARVEGASAVLKLRDGREVTVPVASLSAADRQWLAGRSSPPEAAAAAPDLPKAAPDWPRTVTLPATPTVQVIREDPAKKEFVYETEHYEFVCDSPLGANLVREFSRIFEATWLVNCLLPLDFQPAPEGERRKFRARIYTYEPDYHEAGGPQGSAGVYQLLDQALELPISSLGVKMFGSRVTIDYGSKNYRTLIHEITHQMMNRWIVKLPVWYVEGSAEYVEMTKYENGRFSFLQQDQRLRERLAAEGGGKFQMLPLGKLLGLTSREWIGAVKSGEGAERNYASGLALTYYFYHLDGDGRGTPFKNYLRAVEKLGLTEDGAPLVEKYLLRGRSFETLQKDVRKGLRRTGVNVDFPGS